MRPLAELDRSRLAGCEAVVFDVDDTVTRHGLLEREAFDAMWSLAEAGLSLVAVTGRPLGWVDVLARHWPVRIAVGENGAGWVHRVGEDVAEGYFDGPEARAEQALLLGRVRARVAREMPGVRDASDQRARRCDLAFDVSERDHLAPEEVARLSALIAAEGARVLVSSVHCHVVPGAWDKASGVARAAEEVLGAPLEPARTLFVGDSGNDAAAFAAFPLSVGVANVRGALARLPVPPGWVTAADRGRGFAELAAALLAARG